MSGVAAHPLPRYLVTLRRFGQLMPHISVLQWPGFALPACPLPGVDPFRHGTNQILRVGDEQDLAGASQVRQTGNSAAYRHAVVGGSRFAEPVVAPDPCLSVPDLDQSAGTAR